MSVMLMQSDTCYNVHETNVYCFGMSLRQVQPMRHLIIYSLRISNNEIWDLKGCTSNNYKSVAEYKHVINY